MHGVGRAEFGGRDLAEAQLLDLALADQLGHDADGLLDGDAHVTAVHVVEVDHVDVETAQTPLDGLADVRRVVADDPLGRVVGIDRQTELGGDDDVVAVRLEEGERNLSFSPAPYACAVS